MPQIHSAYVHFLSLLLTFVGSGEANQLVINNLDRFAILCRTCGLQHRQGLERYIPFHSGGYPMPQ